MVLSEKRRVSYRTLPTRHWLNRCHSRRVPFTWTINPYRGCEYGCKYCYARFTHEFLERRDPEAFETEIYAKDWDAAGFARELKAVQSGQCIGLGTATDPYQPAERKFRRTEQVLAALRPLTGITLFVTTKSHLVSRDAAVLADLARDNHVRVSVTITTLDAQLARLLEPMAPRPDLRLEAVEELARAGVPVGVIASPVLPLLTDSEANLLSVARAARQAGAGFFSAGVLFLKPSAQEVFFPFLESSFPEYLARYRKAFQKGAYLQNSYTDFMTSRIEKVRTAAGLPGRDPTFLPPLVKPERVQLRLF